MDNTATFTIEDFDRESTRTMLNIGPLTLVNFTAKRDAIDDLKGTFPGIIAGELRKTTITENFSESADPVTDPTAQRENKWLVTLRDVTQFLDVANTIANVGFGRLFSVEIGTPLLSLLTAGAKVVSLAIPAVASFVAALEAVANSPTGGNEVEVVEIRHVGRNL